VKSSSIRFIVILAILCIVGITITQLYWVRRAFDLKEAEFDRTVNAALFNVANQIFDINNTPSPAMNPGAPGFYELLYRDGKRRSGCRAVGVPAKVGV
jgi:hypothetical protein